MRGRDESGLPNTCSLIDEAIGVLDDSDCSYNHDDVRSAKDALEQVRSINEQLREWGNEQYRRAEDAQEEIECLKRQLGQYAK